MKSSIKRVSCIILAVLLIAGSTSFILAEEIAPNDIAVETSDNDASDSAAVKNHSDNSQFDITEDNTAVGQESPAADIVLDDQESIIDLKDNCDDAEEIVIKEEISSSTGDDDKSVPAEEDDREKTHSDEEIAAAREETEKSAMELGYVPGEILVVYDETVADHTIEEAAEELDGEVADVLDNGSDNVAVVEISEETTVDKAIEEYEADPNVAYAEPNYILTSMGGEDAAGEGDSDSGYDYLNAINTGGAAEIINAWQASGSGNTLEPVSIGIIDTGFDFELLNGRFDTGHSIKLSVSEGTGREQASAISADTLQASDLTDGSDSTKDPRHGTNVAGVLLETLDTIGVLPENLILVDAAVLSDKSYTVSSVVYAINYLKDSGVKVINMSLGAVTKTQSSVLRDALRIASHAGVAMVCSAGNGTGNDKVYPSDDPHTISVMSVNESGELWEDSGSGSLKDIAAPGVNIKCLDGAAHSGTSLSAPMVTAVTATLKSVSSGLSPHLILDILCTTAVIRSSGTGEEYRVLDAGASVSLVTRGFSQQPFVTIDTSAVEDMIYHQDWTDEIILKHHGHLLEKDMDYTITELPDVINDDDTITLSARIDGLNDFSNMGKDIQVTVRKRNIADQKYCTHSEIRKEIFAGKEICPSVSLAYSYNRRDFDTMTEGTDYKIYYSNNAEIGIGTIHVQGINYYTGTLDIEFEIVSRDSLLDSGSCGSNVIDGFCVYDTVTYELYADGILYIKGEGTLTGQFGTSPYRDRIVSVVIENGVQTIDNNSFADCINLTNIAIPKSVTRIGDYAFNNCTSLINIKIPKGVKKIGSYAFTGCASLKSVKIPEGVKSIGNWTFCGCTSLTSINIPQGITRIRWRTFEECKSLTSIEIPKGVTSIEERAFWGCSGLTSIDLPESLTSIGNSAFCGCSSLTSIDLPESVTHIEEGAFSKCSGLTSLEIPKRVTGISPNAFAHCTSLTSIKIPKGVIEIGGGAFEACTNLSHIKIPENVNRIGRGAFSGCSSLTSIKIPEGVTGIEGYTFYACSALTSIDLPESVTKIGDYEFSGCTSLISIKIPEGVIEIDGGAFEACVKLSSIEIPESVIRIGDGAFKECKSLTSIKIPEGVIDIDSRAFEACESLSSIEIPESVIRIGEGAFKECKSLTGIKIPEGVNGIVGYTFFKCSALTSIDLPESLTSIGDHAFSESGLKGIKLPDDIKVIGLKAFYDCSQLQEVIFPQKRIKIGNDAFCKCPSLAEVILLKTSIVNENNISGYFDDSTVVRFFARQAEEIQGKCGEHAEWVLDSDGGLEIIGTGEIDAYYDGTYAWEEYYSLIKKVEIGEGITSSGKQSFSSFFRLETLSLPSTLERIDDKSFAYCTSLRSITIPANIKSIGAGAFYGCEGLKRVNIKTCSFLNTIQNDAFAWNTSLENINLENAELLRTIGAYAFNNCKALKKIIIPAAVRSIGDFAFFKCVSIEDCIINSLDLGSQLQTIGSAAFGCCDRLSSLDFPEKLKSIKSMAFINCSNLSSGCSGFLLNTMVSEIGAYAFYNCDSLEDIDLPESLVKIGDYAFYHCDNLERVGIPEAVTSIGDFSFAEEKNLRSAAFNGEDTRIGKYAFYHDSVLINVSLPSGITAIKKNIFAFCDSLDTSCINDVLEEGYDIARTSDYADFEDDYEAETNCRNMAAGTTDSALIASVRNKLTEPEKAKISAVSSCNVIASVGNKKGTIYAHAPGKAIILVSAKNEEETVTARFEIEVQTPIDADPEGHYKDVAYKKNNNSMSGACSHEYELNIEPATCSQNGSKSLICKKCGETKNGSVQIIPATNNHQYDSGKIVKNATSTEAGIRRFTCIVCGHSYDKTIPMLTPQPTPTPRPTTTPTKEPTKTPTKTPAVSPARDSSSSSGQGDYTSSSRTSSPSWQGTGDNSYSQSRMGTNMRTSDSGSSMDTSTGSVSGNKKKSASGSDKNSKTAVGKDKNKIKENDIDKVADAGSAEEFGSDAAYGYEEASEVENSAKLESIRTAKEAAEQAAAEDLLSEAGTDSSASAALPGWAFALIIAACAAAGILAVIIIKKRRG